MIETKTEYVFRELPKDLQKKIAEKNFYNVMESIPWFVYKEEFESYIKETQKKMGLEFIGSIDYVVDAYNRVMIKDSNGEIEVEGFYEKQKMDEEKREKQEELWQTILNATDSWAYYNYSYSNGQVEIDIDYDTVNVENMYDFVDENKHHISDSRQDLREIVDMIDLRKPFLPLETVLYESEDAIEECFGVLIEQFMSVFTNEFKTTIEQFFDKVKSHIQVNLDWLESEEYVIETLSNDDDCKYVLNETNDAVIETIPF